MSLKQIRHQYLLSAVRSRRRAWTAGELCKLTGLKEPVVAADLGELCAEGVILQAQTKQQQTCFYSSEAVC